MMESSTFGGAEQPLKKDSAEITISMAKAKANFFMKKTPSSVAVFIAIIIHHFAKSATLEFDVLALPIFYTMPISDFTNGVLF